jgi:osmotically-inducible protein OsmY
VEQKLQQQLPQANINVSANKGAVTLQGSVDQQNQKQQAEQIAKSVSGVQSVQNQINAGDFPALGYIPGQDRQRQQMGQQQGGASDAVLAHRIAMQLQQQFGGGQVVHVMNPQAIYIHVSQGTVTLHGSAQDQNQVQQIEQAVQNIRGVQNVQNQLEVGGQQQYGWQTGQQQYGQQTGQQYGRQTGQQMSASDQKLAQQIEQKLQSQFSNANINVTVSQGTATLQGSVQDSSQKQRAEQIARSISGVQNIRNNLSVGGQAGDYPALGYIPGQESQAQQDTGTGISGDTQCIQMFKQGLTDQNLQSMAQNIYVTCNQGTMALYGYVNSDDEKNQLEKATKQVSGIKKVDNNLIVRKEGAKQKSDSELQQDVESQLWWSPYVDSDKIKVSVQNGVVTLSGQVDDWDAMRAAVKNAFDAGAKRVKSQIQYSGQSGQQTATGDRSTAEHPSGIDSSAERQAESR